jgi:hypothetical protein
MSVDQFFSEYIERLLKADRASRVMAESLRQCGVGLLPVVDHCAIRTHDVDKRAKAVLEFGFKYDEGIGVLEFNNWWAKVFRKPGYPTLFIDQAFDGERGKESLIPGWVDAHGDDCFHHIAILVEDIEIAIENMKSKNFEFAGDIVGSPSTDLRQVFTKPEIKDGKVYTVLELIERHNGYSGFLPPQADGLMESTRM